MDLGLCFGPSVSKHGVRAPPGGQILRHAAWAQVSVQVVSIGHRRSCRCLETPSSRVHLRGGRESEGPTASQECQGLTPRTTLSAHGKVASTLFPHTRMLPGPVSRSSPEGRPPGAAHALLAVAMMQEVRHCTYSWGVAREGSRPASPTWVGEAGKIWGLGFEADPLVPQHWNRR